MFFIASIAALLLGPALVQFARRSEQVRDFVDGFALVSVGGLTLLVILPNALTVGGLSTLGFVAAGLVLPALLHQLGARSLALTADRALILGVGIHAAIECAALAVADEHLGIAVAAHRIPVGLAVFMVAANAATGWRYVGLLVTASVLGFAGGQELMGLLSDNQHAWLEGFVAGSLLHVVHGHSLGHAHDHATESHHNHAHAHGETAGASEAQRGAAATASCDDGHHHHMTRSSMLSAAGSLLGIALVMAVLVDPHHHHGPFGHEDEVLAPTFINTFAELALTSAPALLIGYLLAGLVRVFMAAQQVTWLRSTSRGGQALKGVAFGLPLPICSCGVLPLYQSLIRAGVPTTAGIAFLIATPELGIDALLLSLPLLGETLTILRLVAALAVALGIALLMGSLHNVDGSGTADPAETPVVEPPRAFGTRIRNGLAFGFVELFDHTLPWIVLGLVIAALLAPLLNSSAVATLPALVQVPLFALLSVPAYVCAAGATPIAAIAIQSGISPGAALAFLIAGPATNVTTFGILANLHGRRFATIFGLAVAGAAILVGWIVDLSGWTGTSSPPPSAVHSESIVEVLALCALGILTALSLFRQGPRGMVEQITAPFRSVGSHG